MSLIHEINKLVASSSTKMDTDAPLVFKADQRPLDVENIVTDDVRFAVLYKELEVVHGLLNIVLTQKVSDEAQVYVSYQTENIKWDFTTEECDGDILYLVCNDKHTQQDWRLSACTQLQSSITCQSIPKRSTNEDMFNPIWYCRPS